MDFFEESELDTAGKLRGICCWIREIWSSQRREACGKEPYTRRSRYACIVEAHESTRNRLERTLPKIMKIALLRAIQFIESSQSCDITMFQAMKIPDAQAAVDKEWEKLPKFVSMAYDQGQEQKRGHQRDTERREVSSFWYANVHLSLKKNGVETKIPKIEGTSCTPRWHCETRFCLSCNVHTAGFGSKHHKWRPQK